MWTRENRGLYERKGARYPSDLSDAEWALIAPLIPPAKRGGPEAAPGHGRCRLADRAGQTLRPGQGLRGHPKTLGRGTHHRLDQSLPALGQGLRKPQPNGHRLHPPRQHQAYAQKTHPVLLFLMNFPDGL